MHDIGITPPTPLPSRAVIEQALIAFENRFNPTGGTWTTTQADPHKVAMLLEGRTEAPLFDLEQLRAQGLHEYPDQPYLVENMLVAIQNGSGSAQEWHNQFWQFFFAAHTLIDPNDVAAWQNVNRIPRLRYKLITQAFTADQAVTAMLRLFRAHYRRFFRTCSAHWIDLAADERTAWNQQTTVTDTMRPDDFPLIQLTEEEASGLEHMLEGFQQATIQVIRSIWGTEALNAMMPHLSRNAMLDFSQARNEPTLFHPN